MIGFQELCASLRFSGDVGRRADSEHRAEAAEYIARMRAEGLRVTAGLTPGLHASVVRVTERLGLSVEPEVFVVNDPPISASAPFLGRGHHPVVILTSGIVELLTASELRFVIGHELGHHGLGHCPTALSTSAQSEYERLRLMSTQRCGEISTDRIGMVAVRSLLTCAMVMVKLISGLNTRHLRLDVEAFLDQLRRHGNGYDRTWEVNDTHPSLPLRLRALIWFCESSAYARASGSGSAGCPLSDVDQRVQAALDDLGDGLLPALESEQVGLASAWLAASLVFQDGVVTRGEREVLCSLVGDDLSEKVLQFGRSFGFGAVQEKLGELVSEWTASEPRFQRRLSAVFKAFSERLGVQPEETDAWKIIPSQLQDQITKS
jgi:hypothetical protein